MTVSPNKMLSHCILNHHQIGKWWCLVHLQ